LYGSLYRDGPRDYAIFSMPSGLAYYPPSNSVLVCDQKNHAIRVVNLTSQHTSTLVGIGNPCDIRYGVSCEAAYPGDYAEGNVTTARFNEPSSIVWVSGTHWAIVTDSLNHRIRKVNILTGQTELLAGRGEKDASVTQLDGIGAAAFFSFPTGIATDAAGTTVYITDTFNNQIRKITFDRSITPDTAMVTTLAGPGADGSAAGTEGVGTLATFSQPSGVAFFPQAFGAWLIIADTISHRIRMLPLTNTTFYKPHENISQAFVSCFICPAGFISKTANSLACEACAVGTYAGSGSDTCTVCPEGSTTLQAGGSEISACICDQTLYRVVSATGKVSCNKCPVGARCEDGTCALHSVQHNCGKGKDGVSITGTWVRQRSEINDNTFILSSCPSGYQKSAEACVKCATCGDAGGWCARAEYIVDSSDVNSRCQICPQVHAVCACHVCIYTHVCTCMCARRRCSALCGIHCRFLRCILQMPDFS
jgi:hypothetical protein